jgi:hypothetical protein
MAIRARARLAALFDAGSTTEIGTRLAPTDVMKFKDQKKYVERIKASQKATGEFDALVAMQGKLKGRALVASYRTRFFIRAAAADMVALVGFAAFIASGRPLAAVVASVISILLLVVRVAPSQGNLARDQAELDLAASPLRLVDELAAPLAART